MGLKKCLIQNWGKFSNLYIDTAFKELKEKGHRKHNICDSLNFNSPTYSADTESTDHGAADPGRM